MLSALLFSTLALAASDSPAKISVFRAASDVVLVGTRTAPDPCDNDPATEDIPDCADILITGVQINTDEPAPISDPGDKLALIISMGRNGQLQVAMGDTTNPRRMVQLTPMTQAELSAYLAEQMVIDQATGTMLMRTDLAVPKSVLDMAIHEAATVPLMHTTEDQPTATPMEQPTR